MTHSKKKQEKLLTIPSSRKLRALFVPLLTAVVTVLVAASLASFAALAQLQITGVYYDPILAENGGEAVQLENAGEEPIDLGLVTLATKSSIHPLPSRVLLPGAGYLIADTGWSGPIGLRDNLSWPDADFEIGMSLANTEGFVELRLRETASPSAPFSIIDSLAWNSSFKAKEGFMLTPLGAVAPYFRNSNSTITSIPVTITIADGPPVIEAIFVQDDSPAEGVQLLNYDREIWIEAIIYEPNGQPFSAVASFQGKEYEMALQNSSMSSSNLTSAAAQEGKLYRAHIPLKQMSPGKHFITITASDSQASSSETVEINVLSSTTLVVEGEMSFAGTPGESKNATVNVRNEGNTIKKVTIEKTPSGMNCSPTTFEIAPNEAYSIKCETKIPSLPPGTVQDKIRLLVQ